MRVPRLILRTASSSLLLLPLLAGNLAYAQDDGSAGSAEGAPGAPGAPGGSPPDDPDPDTLGKTGLMIRVVVAEGQPDPVSVLLTPVGGGPTETVAIKDDGSAGDVEAGDRTWSGSKWLKGDGFTVAVQTADGPLEAGAVSWDADSTTRDLVVTVDASQVTAEALVWSAPAAPPEGASGAGGPPDPAQSPPAGGGSAVGGSAGPDGGPPGAPGGGAPASSAGNVGVLRIVGAVVGVVLLGLLWWWNRQGKAGNDDLLGAPLAEPGLLGPGTPSLSAGVSIWAVARADAPDLARALLGTLARDRAVVASGPATFPVPAVHGGPVYPLREPGPEAVGDALAWFLDHSERAAGFVIAEAPTLETIAELQAACPEGQGIVVLAVDAPDGLAGALRCRRAPGGWALGAGDGAVVVAEGPYGLVHPGHPPA